MDLAHVVDGFGETVKEFDSCGIAEFAEATTTVYCAHESHSLAEADVFSRGANLAHHFHDGPLPGSQIPSIMHCFQGRNVQGPDDSHAEELGVGVVPEALWKLGIHALPVFTGSPAGGAAEVPGVIIP